MFARVGMLRALNRAVERAFKRDEVGKRKLARDRSYCEFQRSNSRPGASLIS